MEKHMAPVLLEMLLKPEEKWDREMIEGNKKVLVETCKTIDHQLRGREFLCDEYSLADISLTPHLAALGRIKFNPDPALEHFHAWFARLKKRPNFKSSISH
jgi:glutathione S-transferase